MSGEYPEARQVDELVFDDLHGGGVEEEAFVDEAEVQQVRAFDGRACERDELADAEGQPGEHVAGAAEQRASAVHLVEDRTCRLHAVDDRHLQEHRRCGVVDVAFELEDERFVVARDVHREVLQLAQVVCRCVQVAPLDAGQQVWGKRVYASCLCLRRSTRGRPR